MKEIYKSKTWAVNNVDNNAKDKAKKLAKESRKKIGQWITDLIMNSSESNNFVEGVPMKILVQSLNHIHLKIDELHKEIGYLRSKKSFWDKFFR